MTSKRSLGWSSVKHYDKAKSKTTKQKPRSGIRKLQSPKPRATKAQRLKLEIDMIPQTSWGRNLRQVLPPSKWNGIRESLLEKCGYKCMICSSADRLQCDEVWEYDDRRRIQTLTSIRVLCSLCHHVKHIGLAGILAERGQLDFEKVVRHFMAVNNCDVHTFKEHAVRAVKSWKERSQFNWKIDCGDYKHLIST